jgi:hypothetical protein
MALPEPTNSWITGHFADGLDSMCQKKRLGPNARGCSRGLTASMATSYHHNVKAHCHVHSNATPNMPSWAAPQAKAIVSRETITSQCKNL